jgi:hypothetical protein
MNHSSHTSQLESRIASLTHEIAAHRRYSQLLEGMLAEHNIALPHEDHPVAGLAQVIHYREGYWPTKYELDMNQQVQHLVIGKKLSHLSARIVNSKGQTVAPHSIEAFGQRPPRFKFELLCKPKTMDTFENIRVPTTGKVVSLKELVVFEHGSPVNIEDGSFEVNESRWTLRFKPLISSGCPRKTPKLFKVRISPLFDEAYCQDHPRADVTALQQQLTVETEPFRSVLRNYESKALQNFRHNSSISRSSSTAYMETNVTSSLTCTNTSSMFSIQGSRTSHESHKRSHDMLMNAPGMTHDDDNSGESEDDEYIQLRPS